MIDDHLFIYSITVKLYLHLAARFLGFGCGLCSSLQLLDLSRGSASGRSAIWTLSEFKLPGICNIYYEPHPHLIKRDAIGWSGTYLILQ